MNGTGSLTVTSPAAHGIVCKDDLVITGGTFIGTGALGMAQTFSDSKQGVIAVSVGNQSAGTKILLKDKNGNTIIDYSPELNFAVVILSSPDIKSGEKYDITVGSTSGEFEAS